MRPGHGSWRRQCSETLERPVWSGSGEDLFSGEGLQLKGHGFGANVWRRCERWKIAGAKTCLVQMVGSQ